MNHLPPNAHSEYLNFKAKVQVSLYGKPHGFVPKISPEERQLKWAEEQYDSTQKRELKKLRRALESSKDEKKARKEYQMAIKRSEEEFIGQL